MGFNERLRKKSVKLERPAVAWHSRMGHALFGSSLASHRQAAVLGNHCLKGCLHVTHSAVAKRGMFIVDRVILLILTRPSLLGGFFCRSLRCVVCISETAYICAGMFAHGSLYSSILFPYGRFLQFVHTFACSLIFRLWKANGMTRMTSRSALRCFTPCVASWQNVTTARQTWLESVPRFEPSRVLCS